MAGRPRKPDELKILQGTFRKDRDGVPAVVVPDGDVVPPDYLGDAALTFWHTIVPTMLSVGLAKPTDVPQLASMCEWWARHRRYSAILDAMDDNDKRLYQTTMLCAIASTNFDKIAARFGLTPSDRAKLRVDLGGGKKPIISRKRG